MASKSNVYENYEIDLVFRGGALNSSGAVNSTAVVAGVWAASTVVTLGQIYVPHANMTGAGGKFLKCTTAGTTGTTNTLAVPAVGSTLTDNTVTWTAISGGPCPGPFYAGILVINKGARVSSTAYVLNDCIWVSANGGAGGDTKPHVYYCTTAGTTAASQTGYLGVPGEVITDGTAVFTELSPTLDTGTGFPAGLVEPSSGSYARVKVAAGAVPTLTDWAGTQSAGSVIASNGTGATTSNNSAVTFPAPTAPGWAISGATAAIECLWDQPTGGNLWIWAVMNNVKSINGGDSAPSNPAGSYTFAVDN